MIAKFFFLLSFSSILLLPFSALTYADCDVSSSGTSVASFLAGCSQSVNGSTNGIAVEAQSDIA